MERKGEEENSEGNRGSLKELKIMLFMAQNCVLRRGYLGHYCFEHNEMLCD